MYLIYIYIFFVQIEFRSFVYLGCLYFFLLIVHNLGG